MKRITNNQLLLLFCLLKLLAHGFIIHPAYDLHRDEYLHLDQANHLAWGYISVPPLSSWLALLIKPFGQSDALVHLLPALAGIFTLVLVWKLVEALGGNRIACVLSATAVLFSMLLRINMLFQPNSVDILAWTAVYYCIIRHVLTQQNRWLYWAVVSFAVGFLNKYNIVFLLFGLGAALLLTPQRRLYANKHFWLAAALALLLISPNLWWQYRNGFPVLAHMQELSSRQLVNVKSSQFLLEQVLFFLGGLYLIVAGFIAPFIRKQFEALRFVPLSFLITLSTFIMLHAKGYYALGLYPVLIAIGAVWIGQGVEQKKKEKIGGAGIGSPEYHFVCSTFFWLYSQ